MDLEEHIIGDTEPYIIRGTRDNQNEYDVQVKAYSDGQLWVAVIKEGELDATWGAECTLSQTGAYALLKTLEAIVTPVHEDEFWSDWDPDVRMTKETIAAYIEKKKLGSQ